MDHLRHQKHKKKLKNNTSEIKKKLSKSDTDKLKKKDLTKKRTFTKNT